MQRKPTSSKILLAAMTALVGLSALAACNTMKGAGEDISATGDAVTGAAQDTQQDMKNDQ
jgi:predicted small secreted protein